MTNQVQVEDFFIRYDVHSNGCAMHFSVVRSIGTQNGKPAFSTVDLEWTTDISKAMRLMEGGIKWDGCVDMDIGEGEGYQLHFCNLEGTRIITRALEEVYALAAKKIPKWSCA